MENIKKEIIRWFNGPQDYTEGVRLLERVSKKNKVISKLVRKGQTRSSVEKLIWELNKIVGLKKIPEPRKGSFTVPKKPVVVKLKAKAVTEVKDAKPGFNLIGKNDIEDYPPDLRRLVKEYSGKYMLRGKKHAALRALPEDNSDETVLARKELIDQIRELSDRMETLYEAFSNWENTGTMHSAILWPEEKLPEETRKKVYTIEELKGLKKNIQSSLTKDRNQLLYGKKTKSKEENPVPDGPRRTRLEKRITKKEAEILALDQQIAELE